MFLGWIRTRFFIPSAPFPQENFKCFGEKRRQIQDFYLSTKQDDVQLHEVGFRNITSYEDVSSFPLTWTT